MIKPLHLAALILATINAIAGVSLLLLSGWFIAASALAGLSAAALTFNYLVPAASIRFLALTRIASGYGEKAVGHHSLLERLHQLRLMWFKKIIGQRSSGSFRAEQAEHLNQSVEDSANAWLSVIHPSLANLFIIALASTLLCWFTPFALYTWWMILGLNTALWLLIYLQQRSAESAKQSAQSQTRTALEHHFASSPQWLLSSPVEQGQSIFQTLGHWLVLSVKQRQIEAKGDALLILICGFGLVLMLWLLPVAWYGQALIMLPLALLLAMPEWLGNSFRAIRPLIGAQRANKSLATLERSPHDPNETDTPSAVSTLVLNHYGWQRSSLRSSAISIQMSQGQLIWLKGGSGSGKSSLLQALVGITEEWGQAHLGGLELNALSAKQRQQQMHYVEQFPYVLADSLENNLKLASPSASTEQLRQALIFAGLSALSSELEAWVGESGRPLSGGEIKRLGLARAWLKDSPIWLLDEPFEGLDTSKQLELLQRLSKELPEKLIVVASHLWPEGVVADQIINLDNSLPI